MKMRVGFLGCGNIASIVMDFIQKERLNFKVTRIFDIDLKKATEFKKRFDRSIIIAEDIDSLLEDTEIIIEAASQDAVKRYGMRILGAGKNLIVMSVGALSDEIFLKRMKEMARERSVRIYIPSGAIIGVDGLKAAGLGSIDEIIITTIKPPKSLGVVVNERCVVYEGYVKEGIKRFPQNVNVAATLGLATENLDKTKLRIIADPDIDRNIHEIHISGNFGEFNIKSVNLPSPNNPKTSYIAALSAVALLKRISDVVEIGT